MELSNKEVFDQYRNYFSEEPVEVWRRWNDLLEPDGGVRQTTAYRVIKDLEAATLHDGITATQYRSSSDRQSLSIDSWYPQDQNWILCDEEFYAHYFVKWPCTLDDTDRLRQLRKQIDDALWARANRYLNLFDEQKRLAQSRAVVTELLDQYHKLVCK